ncbi:hypothetical protein GCM10020295_35850 [Streptomyces cinereospinus]
MREDLVPGAAGQLGHVQQGFVGDGEVVAGRFGPVHGDAVTLQLLRERPVVDGVPGGVREADQGVVGAAHRKQRMQQPVAARSAGLTVTAAGQDAGQVGEDRVGDQVGDGQAAA